VRILGVEHIGIAVDDLDACIARFESILGLECAGREKVEANKVEVAFFNCGGTKIELVAPTDPESPIQRFVSKGGNALHHICFKVEGIGDWLQFLTDRGVEVVDRVPRMGASGKRVAFIKPKSLCNVLIELSEEE